MRTRIPLLTLLLFTLGCGSTPLSTGSPRSYNGTASVGDFLTITIDPSARTLTYSDLSNGDQGTISYQVNADGTYRLNDPKGNLIAAYEAPNYALVVQAAKAGASHDQPALITAMERGSISISTWAGRAYNYMQLRTTSGGIEIGTADLDSQGNVSVTGYWPLGSAGQTSAFNVASFDARTSQADSSGSFLRFRDPSATYDYVFGTRHGVFAVDTPSGAILGLKKAASKDFDPSLAGRYTAIYYLKAGATMGAGNLESGAPILGKATLVISSSGQFLVQNDRGAVLISATLQPVADADYLYGPAELQDPCYGLFTFRLMASSFQQDVFATFTDRAVLFSSFRASLPWAPDSSYDYLYGMGLK